MTPMLDDRLVDLLVKRATEGVSADEQKEIDRLSASHAGEDLQSIERAAAALALAGDFDEEPLPANLRARLDKSAADFVSSGELAKVARSAQARSSTAPVVDEVAARRAQQSELEARRARKAEAAGTPGSSRFAWFAAAAALVLAIGGWWPRLVEKPPIQVVEVPPPKAPLTPAEERLKLLASNTPLVKSEWTAPGDPATNPVAGDIVWDPKTQKGYMRFTGLKPNDPQQFQYQAWIFDKEQDDRYPIDGGVFDIPAGQSEVVIPIDAGIGVKSPVMFAVTAEKPGGVVVSSRDQLVALARVAAG